MSLAVEVQTRSKGWHVVGHVEPGATGSMSNNTPWAREVVLFTCHGDHSVIEKSSGADVEFGMLRQVTSVALEQLARLAPGEQFESWLQTDRMQRPALFRFRHEC